MDWNKEKKKVDYLDQFDNWINLKEVLYIDETPHGISRINLKASRNYGLLRDLDFMKGNGTYHELVYLRCHQNKEIPRFKRQWRAEVRIDGKTSNMSLKELRTIIPHTTALYLNIGGHSRIYPECAWAADPELCPLVEDTYFRKNQGRWKKKREKERGLQMGDPTEVDSEEEAWIKKAKRRKRGEKTEETKEPGGRIHRSMDKGEL